MRGSVTTLARGSLGMVLITYSSCLKISSRAVMSSFNRSGSSSSASSSLSLSSFTKLPAPCS
jgi:hypothetical protein